MHRIVLQYVIAASLAGAALPCLADQPADGNQQPAASAAQPAASAPANSTSAAPTASAASSASSTAADAPAGPSPEFIKKARSAGYKPETKNGVTQFCGAKSADLGTRFETKKCYSEAQLVAVLNAEQDQRNNLGRPQTCAGAGCGAH